jgi:prepilin peptidase CpaA
MSTLSISISVIAVVVCIAAAVRDARTGHIPNWLTLPLLAAAPVIHGVAAGPMGAMLSLLGALSCAVVPMLMFQAKGMGGGDVKLFAGLGAAFGWRTGLEIELRAFVLALILACFMLAWRGQLLRMLGNSARILVWPLLPKRWRSLPPSESLATLRMGPAIALSCISLIIEHAVFP